MPINQMIAQGIAPIGRDLPQVAGMIYQRQREQEQDRRRNEMLQIEQQQEARRNAMFDEKMGWEREDRGRAEVIRQAAILYPGVQAKDPQAIEAAIGVLDKFSPMDPRAEDMFRQNPDRLLPALDQVLGKQQKDERLIATEKGYLPESEAKGLKPYREPPSYAPTRPQQQVVVGDDGRQYTVDVNSANPRPQPLTTGRNIAGPRGGWIERERPLYAPKKEPRPRSQGSSFDEEVLPPGVPEGSVLIGTSNDNPVYQTPDGKRLIVE